MTTRSPFSTPREASAPANRETSSRSAAYEMVRLVPVTGLS
jgi:hypothetical protein